MRRPMLCRIAICAAGTSGSKGKVGQDEKMDATIKAAATPEAARAQIVRGYNELGELLRDMSKVTDGEPIGPSIIHCHSAISYEGTPF